MNVFVFVCLCHCGYMFVCLYLFEFVGLCVGDAFDVLRMCVTARLLCSLRVLNLL